MLIGENVWLRVATADDALLLSEWFSDPEYLGPYYNVWPETRQDWEAHLTKQLDDADASTFLAMTKDGDEPVGTFGYWIPYSLSRMFQGYEIWYQVHHASRGRGVATQAACLLVNHLFDATPIERIQATAVDGNDASCRVLERAGMQRDGVYRKVFFLHGRYVDTHLYSIVRDDWKDEDAYRAARPPF